MRSLDEILTISAKRKGGEDVIFKGFETPKDAAALAAIPDDRWLSAMTRAIFQAGFNWKVVENMWPGFEVAFDQFDIGRCAMMSDDKFDALCKDASIVRYLQNIRNGKMRDFIYKKNEIIVTPAGTRSGWRWFDTSDVIVVTLDPDAVARFAETELGLIMTDRQLQDLPQFTDPDLVSAGVMLRDTIDAGDIASPVMFDAMARIFLVKLLQKYGHRRAEDVALSTKFTAHHHRRVLDYVADNLDRTIVLKDLARHVGMSPSHFSRVFKHVMNRSPMQYVMSYRVEQAVKMMKDAARPLGEIALACGFADQAHFTRSFKSLMGKTPSAHRAAQT